MRTPPALRAATATFKSPRHGGARIPAMTDPEAPISAPWWWSAVDGHLAPRIRSLATRMSVSETAVWAMAEVMVNRGFSSNMLERAFPELGPLRVKP